MINFESSSEIEKEKEWKTEARNSILEKAKRKYEAQERKEQRAKDRGEDHWLLPSVEARVEGEKKKTKKKKSKKEKKMKKKKKKRDESSSSSSEDENWVEKKMEVCKSDHIPVDQTSTEAPKRDEWMQATSLFGSYTREDIRSQKKAKIESEKTKQEKPGNISRELNPYYKDGGSGLPSSTPVSASSSPGYDAAWLRKALQRAKDQAESEGKTLEEVASSRWGSLEQFYRLLNEAEEKGDQNNKEKDMREQERHSDRHRRSFYQDDDRYKKKRYDSYNQSYHRRRSRRRSSSSSSNSSTSDNERKRSIERRNKSHMMDSKMAHQGYSSRNLKSMMRPPSNKEDSYQGTSQQIVHNDKSLSRTGKWRKKPEENIDAQPRSVASTSTSSSSDDNEKVDNTRVANIQECVSNSEVKSVKECDVPSKILSEKEMNHLAARMTKAELTGNQALAEKLKSKLEAARIAKEKAKNNPALDGNTDYANNVKEEVVLLTHTDARGVSRPLSHQEPHIRGKKGKKPKLFTHDESGKRTIYFPDDEKYNLKQMFEKEKSTSATEQNALFERAAMSNVERLTDDFDMDDMFVGKAALKETQAKQQERERKLAIKEHQMSEQILENCKFCIDNKEMKKHLIVSLGTKCYLSLPWHEPMTEGHCIIAPISHVQSSTRADEDLWQEIMEMRKCLMKMFESQDEDCIFFETCRSYKNLPHLALHCIPLPREIGDLAPIYFKKAIQECEEEWSQNKKLVDLRGKDVRRAVPKELPYFFVDFGLSPGFAHVIEDEKYFKSNFAQEIVGGMIDAEPRLWRKPRIEEFDAQRKRVMQFAKRFQDFDPNS